MSYENLIDPSQMKGKQRLVRKLNVLEDAQMEQNQIISNEEDMTEFKEKDDILTSDMNKSSHKKGIIMEKNIRNI